MGLCAGLTRGGNGRVWCTGPLAKKGTWPWPVDFFSFLFSFKERLT